MSKLFYLVIIVSISAPLSYGKENIKLKDDPEFAKIESDNNCTTSSLTLGPDDDAVIFEGAKSNSANEYITSKLPPYFKLYETSDFKGKVKVELNKDGLLVGDEKKCNWDSNIPNCSERKFAFDLCGLNNSIQKKKNEPKGCDDLNIYRGHFKVEEQTPSYFSMKIDGVKYYMNRKDNPQYEYVPSKTKKAEIQKQILFAKINKNFKKHQKDFLEFVEMTKACHARDNKNCLPRINRSYLEYICYDKKITCESDVVDDWLDTQNAYDLYYKSFSECFDFSKMQIEVMKYEGGENFKIVSFLTGYDRNVICSYEIKLNDEKKDDIKVKIERDTRMEIPQKSESGPEIRDDKEFQSYKHIAATRRKCDRVMKDMYFIPSRLHDKSLQKME